MGKVSSTLIKPIQKIVSFQNEACDQKIVSFLILIGLYASVKLTISGGKYIYSKCSQGSLSEQRFQKRYGKQSWAIIADVNRNEQFCIYLAKMGLKLILLGDQEDLKIIRNMIDFQKPDCETKLIPVNWNQRLFNHNFLLEEIRGLDISFLILPKIPQMKGQNEYGSHVEPIYPFQHHFLLIRNIGPILLKRWQRNLKSVIIFPSSKDIDQIREGKGIEIGTKKGIDALVRTIEYEYGSGIDVICCKESVDECFKKLGTKFCE